MPTSRIERTDVSLQHELADLQSRSFVQRIDDTPTDLWEPVHQTTASAWDNPSFEEEGPRLRSKSRKTRARRLDTPQVEDLRLETDLLKAKHHTPNTTVYHAGRSRAALPVYATIGVEKGIRAAGNAVIERAMRCLRGNALSTTIAASHLGIYAGLQVAATIAEHIRGYWQLRWARQAHQEFLARTIEMNAGRVELWTDDERRMDLEAMLSHRAQGTIQSATARLAQLVQMATGFVVAAGQLSIVLNPAVGVAAAASSILSIAYLYLTQRAIEAKQLAVRDASQRVYATNSTAAENLLLPNKHNRETWQAQANDNFKAEHTAGLKESAAEGLRETGLAIILSAPMGATLGALALRDAAHAMQMVEHALPAFDLMRDFNSAAHMAMGWREVGVDMAYLSKATSGDTSALWSERLAQVANNSDKFNVTHNGLSVPFNELRSDPTRLLAPGRWTVRAPNGTGKSTLLIALALNLQEEHDIYLLPASSQLARSNATAGSTGELKVAQFQDIENNVLLSARAIMLDEWNGNLDRVNCEKLDAMIERWSQSVSIIEVLNHDSGAPQ